jgi:hypothetical protein
MPQDNSKATESTSPGTLTDEHIVTERKLPRRSFFIAAGALVASSAALVACGNNSGQGRSDPDQKRPAAQAAGRPDPDQKRPDPDQQKAAPRPDPDQKKP